MNQKEEKYLRLIAENRNMIFKIASLYAKTNEGREDLMQEIAYQLWKSIDSFKSQSLQSTWLYRIALNTAIQSLKKKPKQISKDELGLALSFSSSISSEKDEDLNRMMQIIHQLKAIDKGIILLYLEEKSHQEIADIVNLSISNVGTRIQRIKKKIKKELQKSIK